MDIQIPKNQYDTFVKRLDLPKPLPVLNLTQKRRINQKDWFQNFGNCEPIESMIRISKERNDSKACDIPNMLIQVCRYLINKQCTRVVLMRSIIIAHLIIYQYNI
jgi:hypothetical protein